MPPEVQPSYDLSQALWPMRTESFILDLSAASAWTIWIPIFQVPEGKRRKLWGVTGAALSADSSGLWIAKGNPGPGAGNPFLHEAFRICAWSTVAISLNTLTGLLPIIMDAGWVLGTWNNANGGDAAEKLTVMFTEEAFYA